MGRSAGWLAEATAFSRVDPKGDMVEDRPPHIILPKEVPFSEAEFLDKLDNVMSRLGEAVVVVQEDLTDKETGRDLAEMHAEDVATDEHGNIQHGRATSFSTSVYLAQLVDNELDVDAVCGKVKDVALVPQHIQRSCMMSEVDAGEAYRVGYATVQAMLDGETKRSVVLEKQGDKMGTGLTELPNIAGKERQVPDEYLDGMDGPTQEFIDEYLYLLGGAVALPHYSLGRFDAVEVPDEVKSSPYIAGEMD
jgi:6-phosphofructokinase